MRSNKTLWERFYSFFGFWTYIHHTSNAKAERIVYWCFLPWFRFYRKFDLFRWDVSKTESINAQRKQLIAKDPTIAEIHPDW